MELKDLIEWAAAEPNDRSVKFSIDRGAISCWVYSYKIQEGQLIDEVSEIDLEGKAMEKERSRYHELKQKFEPIAA